MDAACGTFDNPKPSLLTVLLLTAVSFLSSMPSSVLFGTIPSTKEIHSVIKWDHRDESQSVPLVPV